MEHGEPGLLNDADDTRKVEGIGDQEPAPPEPKVDRLGRYLILDQIGSGGMGRVYSAYDPELDRKVAIKLLHPRVRDGLEGSMARERLLREAKAMAKLSHPNVVSVHDAGVFKDQVFVVMELIEGTTVREWVEGTPRPWKQVLEVFLQAGRGLAAAHETGFIHRDFKPANVLLDRSKRARVTDFGLVSLQDPTEMSHKGVTGAQMLTTEQDMEDSLASRGSQAGSLTEHGTLMGTPRYMSPEQHRREPVDARSDQFSFGVSLYETLYRQRAFSAAHRQELLHAIECGLIRPPPRNAKVPRWLQRIVERCLAPDPNDRYPDMQQVLADLSHNPDVVRRRWLSAAGLTFFVGGAAAWGQAMWQSDRQMCRAGQEEIQALWSDDQKQEIRAAFLDTNKGYADDTWTQVQSNLDDYARRWSAMYTEACEATHVKGEQSETLLDLRMECLDHRLVEFDALIDVLADIDEKHLDKAVSATHKLTDLQTCADRRALTTPVRPPDEPGMDAKIAEVRSTLARTKALGDSGEVQKALVRSDDLPAKAKEIGYPPLTADVWLQRAELQLLVGDGEAAEASSHRALWAAEAGHHDAGAVQGWLNRLLANRALSNFEEAHEVQRYAMAAIQRAGSDPKDLAEMHDAYGALLWTEGKYDEAYEHNLESLELYRQHVGESSPQMASAWLNLGNTHYGRGDIEDAVEAYRRALAIREEIYGSDHPKVADAVNNIAVMTNMAGRAEEAKTLHERVLSIREGAFGKNSGPVAQSLMNLGNVVSQQGHKAEALALYRRALETSELVYGPDHVGIADPLSNLAVVLGQLGEHEQELTHQQRVAQLRERHLGSEHPKYAHALQNLSATLAKLGKLDEALARAESAISILEAAVGKDHSSTWVARQQKASVLRMMGDVDQAHALMKQALTIYEDQLGSTHPQTFEALMGLSELAHDRERLQQAQTWARRALSMQQELAGRESPSLLRPLMQLGRIALAEGEMQVAIEHYRRALDVAAEAEAYPGHLATVHFGLAQALDASEDSPAEVRTLANRAAALYGDLGPAGQEGRARVQRWLQQR